MNLQKSLRIALNIILHSKLRSWLTIIGIVIGVAAIISIVSIGSGFEKDVQSQLGNLGSDTITITPGFDRANECPGPHCRDTPGRISSSETNSLTNKELQAVKSISDITYVNTIITDSKEVYYLGETASITIEGTDVSAWKFITTASLESGRFLGPGDTNSIVIGHSIAEDMFDNKVRINRQLTVNGKSFRVVGILKESGGFGLDDRKIFMPIREAQEVLVIEEKLMIVRHVNEDTKNFTVLSMKTIQERVSAILAGFTLFLGIIAAVSLLVGAVGIANTMFTSVLEKTKEIGIMKALGAKNSDILAIFLFNSGLVGLVGGLIGIIFGVSIALLIPKAGVSFSGGEALSTSISLGLLIFTLIFSIVLGMISGIIPAYRASKLKPVDALRFE